MDSDFASAAAIAADGEPARADALVAGCRSADRDALALLPALRARGFAAPAILTTSSAEPAFAALALAAGFTRLLEQPFGDRMLWECLLTLL